MPPPPSLQELIETVRSDAGSVEPLDQLAVASSAMAELAETADAVLGHFVDQCRRRGHSWTEISGALGVSKQAAHKRFSAGSPSFERFTPRARHVLEGAVDAARRLGHAQVGTEHLLLGLFEAPDGIAARLLTGAGATEEKVAAAVLERMPRGGSTVAVPPFSPAAAETVTGSIAEALQLGHNYVGTEHLLLALFRDPDAVAATILAGSDVSYDGLRAQIVEILTAMQAGRTP